MKNTTLEINGFDIIVEWWDNHIGIQFPRERLRPGKNGEMVGLTMADICEVFSRHFIFGKDGDDRTCLEFKKNDGIRHKPGPKRNIEIEERGPRKAVIEIGGHKIMVTVSIKSMNELILTLPERSVGSDFTVHDLCRAIPDEFKLNPDYKRTHLMCIKQASVD